MKIARAALALTLTTSCTSALLVDCTSEITIAVPRKAPVIEGPFDDEDASDEEDGGPKEPEGVEPPLHAPVDGSDEDAAEDAAIDGPVTEWSA